MKKILCTIISHGDVNQLHVGYEPIILPKDFKLISSFKVSDVYLHFDSNHSIPEDLL